MLPKDMANLRSMRRHEDFLNLKKDLAVVSLSIRLFFFFFYHVSFLGRPFEPYSGQMKEKEGRHNVAVKAFNVVEKRINELKNKLTEVERDKKSAETALDNVKRQVEGQRVLLRQAEDQLAASKGQIIALKKKLEEAKKARDQAEQDGYDVGMAETEKALRAEVSGVCRNYCL